MNLHAYLTASTNFNSKWSIDFSVGAKTIRFLGENLGVGKDFLDTIPKAWSIKETLINWTLSKIQTSGAPKMPRRKQKAKQQTGNKYLQNTHVIKDVMS